MTRLEIADLACRAAAELDHLRSGKDFDPRPVNELAWTLEAFTDDDSVEGLDLLILVNKNVDSPQDTVKNAKKECGRLARGLRAAVTVEDLRDTLVRISKEASR